MALLIPIFGDQLSHGLSSLAGQDKKACVILMAEVDEETEYVPHHKSKMVYILSYPPCAIMRTIFAAQDGQLIM